MISLRPVYLLSLAVLLSLVVAVSGNQNKQNHQLVSHASNDPRDFAVRDGLKGNRSDVRVIGFSSHWPEEHVAKRATMELNIPEIVTTGGTATVSDIHERGPLFSFVWSFTKVVLGGTITGGIGNVLGWGCTIIGFLSDLVPDWTKWPCGAIGFMSVFTNVLQGRGTLTASWDALVGTGATTGNQESWMEWYTAVASGYEKRDQCDWCEAMNNAVYAEVANRTSGQLRGVHFHQYDSSLAVLRLQALMGANETSAIPFAVSINGTLTHLGAKMWLESNATHTGFVSVHLPAHLVKGSATKRDDPEIVSGIPYDNDDYIVIDGQGSTEYGGYYGIYYGDYYYGTEDQFWEVDNDVGGEALDTNGAVYVGAGVSTNMVQESATYGCVCMQTGSDSDWVSTGAVQLGTGPNSWKGYSQCWNSNCDT